MNSQANALVPIRKSERSLVEQGTPSLIEINQSHILVQYLENKSSQSFFINDQPFSNRNQLQWDIGTVLTKDKMTHPDYGRQYVIAESKVIIGDKTQTIYTFLMTETLKPQSANITSSFISDMSISGAANLNLVKVKCTPGLVQAIAEHGISSSTVSKDDEGREYKKICDAIQTAYPDCSDIHFEVSDVPGQTLVRVRVDGDLFIYSEHQFKYLQQTVEIAYNVIGGDRQAGSSIEGSSLNWNKPQTAKFAYTDKGIHHEQRVEFLPRVSENGGDLVVRITSGLKGAKIRPLDDADYHPKQLKLIKKKSATKQGNILLAGVTGSGKSQSMYSIYDYLLDLYQGTRKFIVAENPVEMTIDGITQINLEDNTTAHEAENNKLETKFKRVLQGNLRSDPDVMGTGEVRCKDSATFSMEASKTGHLCLSTIHASSVLEVPGRIDSWGIPRTIYLNSSSLSLVIAQSLIRTVCPNCSFTYDHLPADSSKVHRLVESLADLELLEYLEDIRFANPGGCKECDHSVDGRKGRTLVAEVLAPDSTIRALWVQSRDNEACAHWYSTGGFTKLEHAIYKMVNGVLDPEVIEAEIDDLVESKKTRLELGVPLYHPKR